MIPGSGRFHDVCLIDALRGHGFKIPYLGSGPYWAIADGTTMLRPHGHLGPCLIVTCATAHVHQRNNENLNCLLRSKELR